MQGHTRISQIFFNNIENTCPTAIDNIENFGFLVENK